MKTLIILTLALALTGCTTKTEFGDCIGAFDDKNPHKEYKVSVKNVVLAVFFFQTIYTPIVVVANETYCPVGNK